MWTRLTSAALLVAALLGLAACGDGSDDPAQGACPATPVSVVVTVDQWSDIVRTLAGDCARITTVIRGSSGDPHEYEPTPGDSAAIESAQLVVMNGLGYDEWAAKAVDAASDPPAVVDAGEVADLEDGANPHLWYSPDVVGQVATAVTAELKRLAPDAADTFDRGEAAWAAERKPWDDAIEALRPAAAGVAYAATESVAGYLAEALGMTDATPQGYARAAADEVDPAPADLAAFEQLLSTRSVRVLIANTQTEGPGPERLREVADAHDVAVVEVTETMPSGTGGFVDWQLRQLDRLREALAT